MTNENPIENITNAVGAMAEMAGLMRDRLTEQGFTREEACKMVSNILVETLRGAK